MDPKLAEHHEKIDQLISKRKEQHEKLRKHTRLITATAACFTIGLLILGIFYSMLYLPIAIEKVNKKLQIENSSTVSPIPTQQEDPTANWKTYVNEKYSILFKYPNNFFVTESETKEYDSFQVAVSNISSPNEFYKDDKNISISLTITDKNFKGNTLYYNACCAYGWIEKNFANLSHAQNNTLVNSLTKIGDIKIGTVSAFMFKLTPEYTNETLSTPMLGAIFLDKNKGVLFSGTTKDRNLIFAKEYSSLFNQILSTFKFTQ